MSANQRPLAPPGAGIPAVEKAVARLMLARLRRQDPSRWHARFHDEREKLRRIIDGLDDARASRPVRIARPRGLEESSCEWSVWMTFEHLRIGHQGLAGIIRSLSAAADPGIVVRIEDVKPAPGATRESFDGFEASCDALLAVAEAAWAAGAAARGGPRHPHPWFGPIDAGTWFCLAATHLGLHREQIRRILAAG